MEGKRRRWVLRTGIGVFCAIASLDGWLIANPQNSKAPHSKAPPIEHRFEYRGGEVAHHPRIRLIYWGKQWLHGQNTIKAAVSATFAAIPNSGMQQTLELYYDKNGHVGNDPKVAATYTDSSSPSGSTVTTDQIQAEVTRAIAINHWPGNGVDNPYFVFLPPGISKVSDNKDAWCSSRVRLQHNLRLVTIFQYTRLRHRCQNRNPPYHGARIFRIRQRSRWQYRLEGNSTANFDHYVSHTKQQSSRRLWDGRHQLLDAKIK